MLMRDAQIMKRNQIQRTLVLNFILLYIITVTNTLTAEMRVIA